MMKDSSDAAIARVQPDVRTGRRWDAETAAEAAISDAKFREIQGITRRNRQGVGCGERTQFWSRQSRSGRRQLAVSEVRSREEEARRAQAVQQVQQGAWTSWEGVCDRRISWGTLWSMPQKRVRFLVRGTYGVLLKQANKRSWRLIVWSVS